MPTIKLPPVGKSAGPATVRRWRKKAGDIVAKGDILLEVETDEGLARVESPVAGRLGQIIAQAGKTLPAGSPLGVVEDSSSVREVTPMSAAPQPAPSKAPAAAGPSGPVIPVLMPKAGQSMEEGTLVKWHVKVGDVIQKGQLIFEIETDKATMEVEAPDAGRVARIVLPEGGTMPVLQPVAFLGASEADVEAYLGSGARDQGSGARTEEAPDVHPGLTSNQQLATSNSDGGRVKASPAARKVAAERGVDLAAVGAGSGPEGRILSTDVLQAKPAAKAPAFPSTSQPAVAPVPVAPVVTGDAVRKRMSTMRKAIAKNLSISKQTIPHFYIKGTIDAGPLMQFYQGEKAKYPVSVNDVVVAACARAIMEFPAFRCQIDGEQIVEFPSANIGIAVGMDEGLVVPVLVAAERLTLQQIGSESKRIANNARGGKIEAMGKGVFTITNMGMFGVEEFSAIINPPEAAILAVGTAREEVIVSGGTMRPGKIMTLTLSVDHRIIDGMVAAKFIARLKELLEWPQQLVNG